MQHRLTNVGLLVVAAVVAGGCAGAPVGSPPTSVATQPAVAVGAAPGSAAPHGEGSPASTFVPLSARPIARIRVGGRILRVAVAGDEQAREQGLMHLTDLGSLDGMLFRFHAPTSRAFWMKDTLIPLDIAFFDAAGRFVSATSMVPCRADPCPTYLPAGTYTDAVEAPSGALGFLKGGDTLEVLPGATG